jgi:hypothetical protein
MQSNAATRPKATKETKQEGASISLVSLEQSAQNLTHHADGRAALMRVEAAAIARFQSEVRQFSVVRKNGCIPSGKPESRVKLRSFPRFFPSALLAAMGRCHD